MTSSRGLRGHAPTDSPAGTPEPTVADLDRIRAEVRRARDAGLTAPDDFDALIAEVSQRASG